MKGQKNVFEGGVHVSVRVKEREREYECVLGEKECICECTSVRDIECVCVSVCKWEREIVRVCVHELVTTCSKLVKKICNKI